MKHNSTMTLKMLKIVIDAEKLAKSCRAIIFAISWVLLFLMPFITGCGENIDKGDDMNKQNAFHNQSYPPLDLQVPTHLETATLAMG